MKKTLFVACLICILPGCTISTQIRDNHAPAPLYIDSNYHGSCDPEIVWNREKQTWYIYYTARRATREKASYVGTPIGVISSKNLVNWKFEGYADFADGSGELIEGNKDMPVTFWAPGIIARKNSLHMYVTYKDNAMPPWGGIGTIRHYSTPLSKPVSGWKLSKEPNFSQPDPIDATIIYHEAKGRYHAYYRVAKGGIQWSTSPDLTTWKNHGKVKGDVNTLGRKRFGYQEAPYVFYFKSFWWMLTDSHKGLSVYQSQDSINWKFNGMILKASGTRTMDTTFGRHPSVAVNNGRAFIFYHVEPNRIYGKGSLPAEKRTIEQKKSALQIAELVVEKNKLKAHRNQSVIIRE